MGGRDQSMVVRVEHSLKLTGQGARHGAGCGGFVERLLPVVSW